MEGIYFSMGENQKIALSRAFASKRDIFVLDEPGSMFDPLNGQEMFDRLLEMNGTVIFVTHRLYPVIKADKILYFEDGRISETGNHITLMDKKGSYYEMFLAQSKQFVNEDEYESY